MSGLSLRVFLRGLTLLLCSVVAQHAFSNTFVALAANQSSVARRPLRILVLGDSVMWGQGLRDENKFTYMLRKWLCEQRNNGSCQNNEDVQLHVEAHSGAVIAEEKSKLEEEERFTRSLAPVRYYGEVNYPHPTLWGQVELARRYYTDNSIPLGEVDLILLNGGINDMNATRVLVYKILGGDLKEQADKFCRDEMERLLGRVADTFPNARIVVPSYFPFVSTKTDPNIIIKTIKDLLPSSKGEKGFVEKLIDRILDDRSGEVSGSREPKTSRTLRKLSERSKEWVKVSNNALEEAIIRFNSKRSPLPLVRKGAEAPTPKASLRAHFVSVPFDDENAYLAPKSFLWHLTGKDPKLELKCVDKNLLSNLVTEDPLQEGRPCMCDHAGKRNDISCIRAGTFHPNTKGAEAYFQAIKEKLEIIMGFTGWVPGA